MIQNNRMSHRVTVMINDELVKKIRTLQAKKIKDSASSVSFSSVLNQLLRDNLK